MAFGRRANIIISSNENGNQFKSMVSEIPKTKLESNEFTYNLGWMQTHRATLYTQLSAIGIWCDISFIAIIINWLNGLFGMWTWTMCTRRHWAGAHIETVQINGPHHRFELRTITANISDTKHKYWLFAWFHSYVRCVHTPFWILPTQIDGEFHLGNYIFNWRRNLNRKKRRKSMEIEREIKRHFGKIQ